MVIVGTNLVAGTGAKAHIKAKAEELFESRY